MFYQRTFFKISFALGLSVFFISCSETKKADKQSKTTEEIRKPSSFFTDPKAKVLVVGTFHFNYPGLDAYKTAESDQVDVLSPERQNEMTELVEYIKRFKPNKIVLESRSSAKLTQNLRDYRAGTLPVSRSEHYQIGMRIASELELDTLYALDTESLISSIEKETRQYFDSIAQGYDFHSNSRLDSLKLEWYKYEDQLKLQTTLLEYLKHINSPEYHKMDYGMYLIGDFKIGEHGGADVLAAYWYSRNLRLFRKIQDIIESSDDRVLVVFGNAHASLLRQYLECSPEFEYVEFSSLEQIY
jgi:hypothetical protein